MTQERAREEREAQDRAKLQEESGRLFGLVIPKQPESDGWLYDRLVDSARYWNELEDERHYELLASIVLHSGRVRENQTTPYLFCHGPPGTGKNRIGHWLRVFCHRGFMVVSPKPANLFWTMERHHPTLIIDEAEKLAPYHKNKGELAEALIEILNADYQQNQLIPRVQNETGTLKFYDPYGLKVILSTEDLPDATKSRCIVINTDENVNWDIPVSHPTTEDSEIKPLRQYLEYYWGQYQPNSLWAREPEPSLTLDQLKLMIPNYRSVEKFGPLYRVTPDPQRQKHILELAVEDANDRREERGTSMDAEILQALAHARETELIDRYTVADIAKRFNEGREKWETLSSEQIGRKLRKFGLKPSRGHGGVRCVLWDEARMARRFKRYGIRTITVTTVTPNETVTPTVTQAPSQGDSMTVGDSNGTKGQQPDPGVER